MTYICATCIEEPTLKKIVQLVSSNDNPCEYCESTEPTVHIDFIAEKCDEVLSTFFEVSSLTMAVVVYDYTPSGNSLRDTLSTLIGAPDDAIFDIAEVLETKWYDCDSGDHLYGEDPWFITSNRMELPLSRQWEDIESSLRNEGRYLNPKVSKFMDTLFGGIGNDVSKDGIPVLVNAGPGTHYETLYRARLFQNEESIWRSLKHPERFLGAPPVGIARSGRMNAVGQPAFYGATDIETTLAEVRPVVGSWVVAAKFSIDRPLKLLDLRLLENVILPESASLFEDSTKMAAQRRDFLRKLCNEMVLPVMPEHQDRGYLVTQVVANYLATHPITSVDGIIYPSVQLGRENLTGENVVLFYKAAMTTNADSDQETAHAQLWEYDDDGPGRYFSPTIEFSDFKPRPSRREKNYVQPTLSLIQESIEIHEITSVKITSKMSAVNKHSLRR